MLSRINGSERPGILRGYLSDDLSAHASIERL